MYGTVADFLRDKLQDGASLSFVSAYFTINAFNALRDSLTGIDNLRFLFGQPDVVNGMDPSKTESKAFRLTEEGLDLRTELSQSEIAKACAEWIEQKVKIRSVHKSNFLHGKMYYIEKDGGEDAIVGSSNFTVRGLGLSEKASNIELNLEVDSKNDCADLKKWFDNLWESDERDFVVEIIEGKQNIRDWHRDVVSSELDADKMDYLLRDSYFAGVKYGIYDLEKIIESCLIEVDKTETSLAINSKGIYALEQLLLARYHMTRQVYWHRVSLISNEMIIRGITLAIEEGNTKMKELYQYDENDKENFIQKYLNYHDENVVDILRNCPQEKAQAIFSRLYGRKLFKTVANLRLKDETNIRVKRRLLTMKDDPQLRLELETAVADYLGIDADYVIIKPLQIRNPNYGSRSYILNPEAITIVDEWSSEPRAMSDYTSELFFARPLADDETSLEMVQVYVPPEGDNLSQKQRRLALEPEIQNILRSA